MFSLHPSSDLQDLFKDKPHQGADPKASPILFVGLDANYSESLAQQEIFRSIIEYHSDGPGYWRRTGHHHPFLDSRYKGGGRKYHRNFAQIGFTAEHAHLISFVELLAVPTVGRSALKAEDLDLKHLQYLREAIFQSDKKSVFVSASVANLMNKSRVFPPLSLARDSLNPLPIAFQSSQVTIYRHLHFSVYGKFERSRLEEAFVIRRLAERV